MGACKGNKGETGNQVTWAARAVPASGVREQHRKKPVLAPSTPNVACNAGAVMLKASRTAGAATATENCGNARARGTRSEARSAAGRRRRQGPPFTAHGKEHPGRCQDGEDRGVSGQSTTLEVTFRRILNLLLPRPLDSRTATEKCKVIRMLNSLSLSL